MGEKKKWSEIVLEERDKGNVVLLCIDEVVVAPVKEIIKQPAEGLLWDLNRDGATALSFMDEEGMIHWVNNFAVSLVIKELKSQLAQFEAENAALKRENEDLRRFLRGVPHGQSLSAGEQDELDDLLTAEEQEK